MQTDTESLRFLAPVRAGDTVHATVVVKQIAAEKRRVLLSTDCTVRGVAVISGEALVKLSGAAPAAGHDVQQGILVAA